MALIIGKEFSLGAFYYRCIEAEDPGDFIKTHDHNFAHNFICYMGEFVVQTLRIDTLNKKERIEQIEKDQPDGGDGRRFILYDDAGQLIQKPLEHEWIISQHLVNNDLLVPVLEVKAGVFHRLIALQPMSRGMCTFLHVDWKGRIHETYQGRHEGYR